MGVAAVITTVAILARPADPICVCLDGNDTTCGTTITGCP